MNKRTPADPPPVLGEKDLTASFAPGIYVGTGNSADSPVNERVSVQPRKSFFRGVAVAIAIMIPIWAWLIIRLLR